MTFESGKVGSDYIGSSFNPCVLDYTLMDFEGDSTSY